MNAHLTQDTVGGATDTELRVFGPLVRPFRVADVSVVGLAGVQVGHFVDVLVSPSGDTTDVATPDASSIFAQVRGIGGLTSPDGDAGVAVPAGTWRAQNLYVVPYANQFLVVRLYALAPAVGLPDVFVSIVVEELDLLPQAIEPRPAIPSPPVEVVAVEEPVTIATPIGYPPEEPYLPAPIPDGFVPAPAPAYLYVGQTLPATVGGRGHVSGSVLVPPSEYCRGGSAEFIALSTPNPHKPVKGSVGKMWGLWAYPDGTVREALVPYGTTEAPADTRIVSSWGCRV